MKPITVLAWLLTALTFLPAAAMAADAKPDPGMAAMEQELMRTFNRMRTGDEPLPYFVLYRMEDATVHTVMAANGALVKSDGDRRRTLYTEVRVGDYKADNYYLSEQASYYYDQEPLYNAGRFAPLSGDPLALRSALWLLSEENYRSALANLYSHRGQAVVTATDQDREGVDCFSHEQPVTYQGREETLRFAATDWEALLAPATRAFADHQEILNAGAALRALHKRRHLATSEGSRIREDQVVWQISVYGDVRADDGDLLSHALVTYARTPEHITKQQVQSMVDELIDTLKRLAAAPVFDPYSGPALLLPRASAVLFHEVVGHRLEGERQLMKSEGRTFKGKVGQQVLPPFISVYDDPTMERFGQEDLNGYYRFDDEGVPASRVTLVEKGVLKNFLMSRTPVKGFGRSNGHGRSSIGSKPMARMGNTIIQAEADHRKSLAALEVALQDLMKAQDKQYGIVVEDMAGGDTNTSSWGYQAFRGASKLVYRVDRSGRRELVRGVMLVGTPLSSLNKILMASDEQGVFNGYCGAESGMVPVSAVAPALLFEDLELQRAPQQSVPAPILPSPFQEAATSPGASPRK